VPARFCDVPRGMMPHGCRVPVPTANAVSSRRSFASARSSGSCAAKSESPRTSNEPNRYASAFCRGDLQLADGRGRVRGLRTFTCPLSRDTRRGYAVPVVRRGRLHRAVLPVRVRRAGVRQDDRRVERERHQVPAVRRRQAEGRTRGVTARVVQVRLERREVLRGARRQHLPGDVRAERLPALLDQLRRLLGAVRGEAPMVGALRVHLDDVEGAGPDLGRDGDAVPDGLHVLERVPLLPHDQLRAGAAARDGRHGAALPVALVGHRCADGGDLLLALREGLELGDELVPLLQEAVCAQRVLVGRLLERLEGFESRPDLGLSGADLVRACGHVPGAPQIPRARRAARMRARRGSGRSERDGSMPDAATPGEVPR
jgi:hypothetical protein